MDTHSIILPIDKKRSAQLLVLLEMFGKNAVLAIKEIEEVIPSSTFYSLIYKLKLLNQIVRQRHGFDLFVFEKVMDFDSMTELKADFNALKEIKVMKLNAEMETIQLDGLTFVEFVKKI